MVTEQLKSYIQEAVKSGKTKEEIRQSLLGAGWQETDITEALDTLEVLSRSTSAETPTPESLNTKSSVTLRFFNLLKTRLKHPKTYYVLGVILLIAGAIFLYQKVVFKELERKKYKVFKIDGTPMPHKIHQKIVSYLPR